MVFQGALSVEVVLVGVEVEIFVFGNFDSVTHIGVWCHTFLANSTFFLFGHTFSQTRDDRRFGAS
jgi:hypothetical protein